MKTSSSRPWTSWSGCLSTRPSGVADQPDRQRQGQFAALGLVEQSGGQAGAQGMQLQFGDQALEAEDQPAVGRGGVVDAVLVADEATAIST